MTNTQYTEPTVAHDASVICMHCLGGSSADFADMPLIIKRPGTRRIFPNAPVRPVTLNQGYRMPSWFDIRYMVGNATTEERESREEAADSSKLINTLIEAEHARGVPYSRIVLIGFSQGGAMSLYTGCRFPHSLAGMVCLSGYLLFPNIHLEESAASNRKTPILICHGTQDPMVPHDAGIKTRDFLTTHDWPVSFQDYPMQHEVCIQEIEKVDAFLRQQLDG